PVVGRAQEGSPRSTYLHRRIQPRRAHGTALGDDLDHPVRGIRPVQRRRRRALDDLDALDVTRIDVAEPGERRVDVPGLSAALDGLIGVHPYTVDEDYRIAREGGA